MHPLLFKAIQIIPILTILTAIAAIVTTAMGV